MHGDVELRDVETGESRELTISPSVLADVPPAPAQALLRDLEGYCRERAIPCFTLVSDQPFDAVVLRMFRAGGFLRCATPGWSSRRCFRGRFRGRAAAVAGAAGAVAITALYLVRLRRRRVVVSFAPLWLDAVGAARTTSWARRLRDCCRCCWRCRSSARAAGRRRPAPRGRRSRRAQPGRPDRSLGVDVRARRPGTRLDAARARANARSSTAWPPPIGRSSRRSRPTPSPRAASRRTPPTCDARSPPSRPARSRATCRAR